MADSDTIVVLTTMPDSSSAEELAESLVTAKLAACVNVMPAMTSIYMWQDKLEHGSEHQLLIKTRAECYESLANVIQSRHPYELPEIIAIPVCTGLPAYLNWIAENTRTS